MKYTVEDISPCKSKIHVTADPEEVTASIDAAVALQKSGIAMDGFRKGHVPADIVEKRFKHQLYSDARQDLMNVHINTFMQELKAVPLGGLDISDTGEFKRGSGMDYFVTYEHLPVFTLPSYEGIEVEQEEKKATPDEIDALLARLQLDRSKLVPVEGNGPAKDGEYVNIDFDISVEGKPVSSLSSRGYDMLVGQKSALPELEELVKELTVGQTGEKAVHFPADFLNKEIAGKSGEIKIVLHAIKKRELPTVDQKFASDMGVASVDELRTRLAETLEHQFSGTYKAAAERKLLDGLLKQVDFELPQTLIDVQLAAALSEQKGRSEQKGKSLDEKQVEELKKSLLPQVREQVKGSVFLMSVAAKENLNVSEKEVQLAIAQYAHQLNVEFKQLYEYYQNNGAIFTLRDRLLADKGMEAIYAKAKVTMVPAKVENSTAGTEAPKAGAPAAE